MRDIRIGNDVSLRWSIYTVTDTIESGRQTTPYTLEGKDLNLWLIDPYARRIPVQEWRVDNNSVEVTIHGKDQAHIGIYQLTLVENSGKKGMMTVDACNAFRLVPCSCKVTDGSDDCGIKTEVVDIESMVEYGGTSVDTDTLNEILSTCCSLDFNDDFNNDYTIGL